MLKPLPIWSKFAQYSKIVVSGPQRSGSTFAAFLTAKRLGYERIDETRFNWSDYKLAKSLFKNKTVLHCPALTHVIEDFAAENTMIIFMIRDIKDIIASQERINWIGKEELEKYNLSSGIISEIKYSFWQKQKEII